MTEETQQKGAPVKLGAATVESGDLPVRERKGGGVFGPRGSKYDPLLEKIPDLPASNPAEKKYTFIKIELNGEPEARVANAIRTAMKRKFGNDITKSVKLRAGQNDTVLLFRI